MNLSARELAYLERASSELQILESDEQRLLTKYSMKLGIDDLLTSGERRNLEALLAKLASEDAVKKLESKVSQSVIEKLRLDSPSGVIDDVKIYDQEAQRGLLATAVEHEFPVRFVSDYLDSAAFFRVEERTNELIITLNTTHRFYDQLKIVSRAAPELHEFVLQILHAWGLQEIELHSDEERERIAESRELWGRKLRNIMRVRYGRG